jgi:glutamate dehydrogenase/leucine dehydrogenase
VLCAVVSEARIPRLQSWEVQINGKAIERAVSELGATPITPKELLTTECDVFSPCALGAVINADNAKEMKCKIVGGCANNVLVDNKAGEALAEAGILYLPDYIINAGGVLNCGAEIPPNTYNQDAVAKGVENIYNTTRNIIALLRRKILLLMMRQKNTAGGLLTLLKNSRNKYEIVLMTGWKYG